MSTDIIVLALGSNYGNRLFNLKTAIKMLPLCSKTCSHIYENKALTPINSPDWWNMPFLNMTILGYSNFSIQSMLCKIQTIEKHLGRNNKEHWSPRSIDIDIIFWKNTVLVTEQLTIPHKQMHKRNFVLTPICDIAPNFVHPVFQITTKKLLEKSQLPYLTKKWKLNIG